jgi:O-acetyl-ADP-ribose deacetylase (regulator of RNase III)
VISWHPSEDMFDDPAAVLVNAINCHGNMGGGLAYAFKQRFPAMNTAYELACKRDEVHVNKMHVWYSETDYTNTTTPAESRRCVVNFPTKDHWRDPSKIEWIENGLVDLVAILRNHAVAPWPLESIAVPMLGCGLGGLSWNDVCPLIIKWMSDLDMDVRVFGEKVGD